MLILLKSRALKSRVYGVKYIFTILADYSEISILSYKLSLDVHISVW